MKIVGFSFEKIAGEKFKEPEKGTLNVNSNFNVIKIQKEEISSKEDNIHSIKFEYATTYPEIAKIEFVGKVFVSVDKKLAKEIEKEGAMAIDNKMKEALLNFVIYKTHIESLKLEENLTLPFHSNIPRVSIKSTSE